MIKLILLIALYNLIKCNVLNYLLPIPNNITKGKSNIYLNDNCYFNFISAENENIDNILKVYKNIFNKKKIINFRETLTTECKVDIKIEVLNPIIIKYSTEYDPFSEKYKLLISENLDILINTKFLNGLLRGLETLSQIIHFNKNNSKYEISDLPISIEDFPRFGYRGVMIDTSRHFISLENIKKIIDGMLYSKLNVLHWHLTDDEYFSFQTDLDIKVDKEFSYSKFEIKKLIDYAFWRGITIIPEIDNPSHTRSWILNSNNSITISKNEYGTLNPILDLTYETVNKLIKEVKEVFNSDIIHLGGDEIISSFWNSTEIKNFMKENELNSLNDLENYYFNKVRKYNDDGKYIYWVDNNSYIYDIYKKSNSILMYWGYMENISNFLDKINSKIRLILSPADYLYLDCGLGNKYGDISWCGDYKTWRSIYNMNICLIIL